MLCFTFLDFNKEFNFFSSLHFSYFGLRVFRTYIFATHHLEFRQSFEECLSLVGLSGSLQLLVIKRRCCKQIKALGGHYRTEAGGLS